MEDKVKRELAMDDEIVSHEEPYMRFDSTVTKQASPA